VATGIGRVVRQFGGYGMFAIVGVEATPRPDGFSIEIDRSAAEAAGTFRAAVEVGVRYAWEHLDRYARPSGVAVRVTEVQVMVVDTTEIAVIYAAALALWDALKLNPDRPVELIPETRSLRFPV
jgi:hypothetical protein